MSNFKGDKSRRIDRFNSLFKALNNEETDIIAEYEEEFGQPDYWEPEVLDEFNSIIGPVQNAKNEIYRISKSLEGGWKGVEV